MEKYFFEIPIYRCTFDAYLSDLKKLEDKISKDLHFLLRDYPDKFEILKNDRYSRKSYLFDYNETIGWIKLYILGNQIRGEYFFETDPNDRRKERKRIDKGIRKKQFDEYGKAFELTVKNSESSENILDHLLRKIKYLSENEKPFKGRYIDTTTLENIGRFVNWKELVENINAN